MLHFYPYDCSFRKKGHLVLCMMVGKKWLNAGIKSEWVYLLNCLCHTLRVSEKYYSHAKWPRFCYKSVCSKRKHRKHRCCTCSLALETKEGKHQKSLLNSSLALKSLYLQNPFKNLVGLKLSWWLRFKTQWGGVFTWFYGHFHQDDHHD